jgi:hypothetical protein
MSHSQPSCMGRSSRTPGSARPRPGTPRAGRSSRGPRRRGSWHWADVTGRAARVRVQRHRLGTVADVCPVRLCQRRDKGGPEYLLVQMPQRWPGLGAQFGYQVLADVPVVRQGVRASPAAIEGGHVLAGQPFIKRMGSDLPGQPGDNRCSPHTRSISSARDTRRLTSTSSTVSTHRWRACPASTIWPLTHTSISPSSRNSIANSLPGRRIAKNNEDVAPTVHLSVVRSCVPPPQPARLRSPHANHYGRRDPNGLANGGSEVSRERSGIDPRESR